MTLIETALNIALYTVIGAIAGIGLACITIIAWMWGG